jgi:HSP20 family protein
MTLIRWSPTPFAPLRDLPTIQDEVNRLFDSAFTRGPLRADLSAVFTPLVDVEETSEEFILRADLPGVAQKDVKVSLMGDTLTIRGERKREIGQKDGSHHRIERLYGTFERSFTLGSPVRNDQVKAQYRDGVLEVHVPKAEEARIREIEVQVG